MSTKNIDFPDNVINFEKGNLDNFKIGRARFEQEGVIEGVQNR
jgi:hypothetical protein